MNKRLYRSTTNKFAGGVCGGIAQYLDVDPTLVRLITVLLIMFTGVGLIPYIVLWIVMPEGPDPLGDTLDYKRKRDVIIEE